MATYTELATLESDPDLQKKVEVALWVAVAAIVAEDSETPNHSNRLKHAKQILGDSDGYKQRYLKYLLAANEDQSLATITGASDAQIQAKVNDAINIFADGA